MSKTYPAKNTVTQPHPTTAEAVEEDVKALESWKEVVRRGRKMSDPPPQKDVPEQYLEWLEQQKKQQQHEQEQQQKQNLCSN